MEKWEFTLYDSIDSVLLVAGNEPIGWASTILSVKRDKDLHGLTHEYSSPLKFIKAGYDYIRLKYDTFGINHTIFFEAKQNFFDGAPTTSIFVGRLNLSSLKFTAEAGKTAECSIETESPKQTFINHYSNQVDITSLNSFDNQTAIPDLDAYAKMGYPVEFHGADLIKITKLVNGEAGEYTVDSAAITAAPTTQEGQLQPCMCVALDDNEGFTEYEFDCQTITDALQYTAGGSTIRPFFTNILSEPVTIDYAISLDIFHYGDLSGNGLSPCPSPYDVDYKADVFLQDETLTIINSDIQAIVSQIGVLSWNNGRTVTLTGTTTLAAGSSLALYAEYTVIPGGITCSTLSTGNATIRNCGIEITRLVTPANPTNIQCYMVNETFARIAENITNNAITAQSDYFGRLDSQPIAGSSLGCGGNTVVTTGLFIRNAKTELQDCNIISPNADKMFLSMKETFDAMNCMHNLGMGIEFNKNITKWVARIEPVEYFYQNTLLIDLGTIDIHKSKFTRAIASDYYVSSFGTGYDAWKTEEFAGLDEVNTGRFYNIAGTVIKNAVRKICSFVTGSYAIENTRRKANTNADWRFDDNTFSVRVDPTDFSKTQKGVGGTPANMQNASTAYNFADTPYYMALRWANWLNIGALPGYLPNFLRFASGEGNFIAEGDTPGAHCVGGQHSENQNISGSETYPGRAPVFIKPEIVEFDYFLYFNQYNAILANMYGLIRVNGEDFWILELEYRPQRVSHFKLIKKL